MATTHEPSASPSGADLALRDAALQRCANACGDVERGYLLAAGHAEDARLRRMFRELARERGEFLELLRDLGAPTAQRAWTSLARWMTIQAKLVMGRDATRVLLADCGRRERRAERTYLRARAELSHTPGANDVRNAIGRELGLIAAALTKLDRSISRPPVRRVRHRRATSN